MLTTIDDGKLAPGHSPGCITAGAGLKEYGTYEAELGGTTACTEYDQVKVTGTIDLGGTNGNAVGKLQLNLFNGFKPAAGNSFTLIDNDGSGAVVGTFAAMAEGSTFTADGIVYKISYVGGDGNDVVVGVQNVPITPDTGFAMIPANPLLSVLMASASAGGLLYISQKTRLSKAAVRSRK